jgi:hypothetical protein
VGLLDQLVALIRYPRANGIGDGRAINPGQWSVADYAEANFPLRLVGRKKPSLQGIEIRGIRWYRLARSPHKDASVSESLPLELELAPKAEDPIASLR